MLDGITTLSIFVNAAIVAFTGTYAINDTWSVRIWIFILMSGGLLRLRFRNIFCFHVMTVIDVLIVPFFCTCSVKLLLQYFVPDVPADIEIQVCFVTFSLFRLAILTFSHLDCICLHSI